jgi:hypothetical protein
MTLSSDNRYTFLADGQGGFGVNRPNTHYLPANRGQKYALVAHDPKGRWADVISEPFEGRPGEKFEFKLTLGVGGFVRGRVRDADGNGVAGVEIEAFHRDEQRYPYFGPRVTTDKQGSYHLGPLRTGWHRIVPDQTSGVNFKEHTQYPRAMITLEDRQEVLVEHPVKQEPALAEE